MENKICYGVYLGVSDNFQRGGVYEMARTLKATAHDSGVIEIYSKPRCKVAGNLTGGVWDKMHEQSKRVYDPDGISPTVHTCGGGNLEPKVVIKQATSQGYTECEIGGVCDLSFPESKTRRGRVQEGGKICPTITAESNGLCRVEHCIAAMRGRNPDKPTSRKSGLPTQQMLEVKDDGTSNTLTTVQKDNLVVEPKLVGGVGEINFGTQYRQGNRIYDSDAIAMALMAGPVGNAGGNSYLYKVEEPQYRVRKLTPKECWRLMGFTDDEFDMAKQNLNKTHYKGGDRSNSQLYKQAGNSIVKQVLMAIFGEMKE